jgi:hypothetical protein
LKRQLWLRPLSGLSNKFFDILIVSLEFGASFALGKLPVHRGAVEIALRRPRLHFLAQRLDVTNAGLQALLGDNRTCSIIRPMLLEPQEGLAITLRSLVRLWQESGDSSLPAAMASILQSTSEEIETLLSSLLDSGAS